MQLPEGWDTELQAAERARAIHEAEAQEELAKVGRAARVAGGLAMSDYASIQQAWKNIRSRYPIEHPELVEQFHSDEQAGRTIMHYWVGEEIDQAWLLRSIMGFGDTHLWNRAIQYAQNLTDPHSPERANIQRASDFLWRDYRGGHG